MIYCQLNIDNNTAMTSSTTISPTDMLLYVDVVREGSFTAAARHVGISKQAVSERIYKLEAALGVRLLQRTTRSLRMTDAGMRYHAECAQIAQQIEQANLAVQAEAAAHKRTHALRPQQADPSDSNLYRALSECAGEFAAVGRHSEFSRRRH
jgi:DNA-binding transcriptional LysR family regulator